MNPEDIDRLEALLAEAREVVRPFAEAAQRLDTVHGDDVASATLNVTARVVLKGAPFDAANFPLDTTCSCEDFRSAAAWLAKVEAGE